MTPPDVPGAQRLTRAAAPIRGRGICLGMGASGLTWAGREHATLVLGPSRSGKTSSLVVPNVLAAEGAVLSTSTKTDVLRRTVAARRAFGWCALYDPSGTVEPAPGVHRVGWSPVVAARDWDDAVGVADSMVRAARGQRFGTIGAGHDGHWAERAASLLGPLLHAAALSKEPMRTVVHWVDRHDGSRALSVLEAHYGDVAVPTDVLAGILSTDPREQSGIWSTASSVLGGFVAAPALRSTDRPAIEMAQLTHGCGTLFICASSERQQHAGPMLAGLIRDVRTAVYDAHAAAVNETSAASDGLGPPRQLLAVLDELANIAPLHDLPALVAEGGSQGISVLACLQDLSQARVRWGAAAEGFFSLFSTKVIFPGIGDQRTLELVSALAGDIKVKVRSVTKPAPWSWLFPGRHSGTSVTNSEVWRRRLPLDEVYRGTPGQVFMISSGSPVYNVGAQPWWNFAYFRAVVES